MTPLNRTAPPGQDIRRWGAGVFAACLAAVLLFGSEVAQSATRVSVSYQLQSGPCYALNNPNGPTYSPTFLVTYFPPNPQPQQYPQALMWGWCGAGGPNYLNGIEQTSIAWPPDALHGLGPGQTASLVDDNPSAARQFYVSVQSSESPNDDVPDGTFSYTVVLTDPGGGKRTLTGSLAPGACAALGSTPEGGAAQLSPSVPGVPGCEYYLPPDTAGTAGTATCKGKPATVVGTTGNDVRSGTPGRDVMVGLGGNDRLSGLAGNDVICGGPGNDKLNGGKGKDVLLGQKGKDKLNGGPGKDKQIQ